MKIEAGCICHLRSFRARIHLPASPPNFGSLLSLVVFTAVAPITSLYTVLNTTQFRWSLRFTSTDNAGAKVQCPSAPLRLARLTKGSIPQLLMEMVRLFCEESCRVTDKVIPRQVKWLVQ